MQFTIAKAELCAALAQFSGIVGKRTTVPILAHVKLAADERGLTISGTDLELSLTLRIPAKVTKLGSVTLPAKRLHDYARLLSGDVSIKVGENSRVTVSSGRSRSVIPGMDAESFPEITTLAAAPSLQITGEAFSRIASAVKCAISKEESRFTLNGALLDVTGETARMVATDGHRLAVADGPCAGASKFAAIIPQAAMLAAAKLWEGEESVSIGADDNNLYFASGDTVLSARRMTGNFPDYARVLPKDPKLIVELPRKELAAAIGRVAQFTDEWSRAIRVKVNGEGLELYANSIEVGESTETLPCEALGEIEVGFNASYLTEFLAVMDTESVEIRFIDGKSAAELRPSGKSDYRAVVMPMRI